MPSNVRPSQFKDLLAEDGDTICDGLLKYIRAMVLFWRYHKYKYKNDGTFTKEFQDEICSITCPETVATETEPST